MKKNIRYLLISFGYFANSLLIFLGLPLAGWGLCEVKQFFNNGVNLGYAVVVFCLGIAVGGNAYFHPGEQRGTDERKEKRIKRQTIVRFTLTGLLFFALFFLPFADRREIAVFVDLAWMRWTGLALFALGTALVIWSGIELGKMYSAEVTLQEDHHLVTSGPYQFLRHPRYLGGILYVLGFSLIFRSWIGVIGTLISIAVFLQRIRDEEPLMQSEFGEEWDDYCKTTWRLLPYIY